MLVHLRNGLQFAVRAGTSDFGVLDDVFMRNVYGRALDRIVPGDVVIDIGAQCGAFALAAAARGARVLCFEPLPENADLLLENAWLNGLEDRIDVTRMAVASLKGAMDLYTSEDDTGGATFFPMIHPDWGRRDEVHKVAVQCVTLHDIFARQGLMQCGCLKMDCEGAEFEILQGAEPDDLRRTRTIILEYHPNGAIEPIAMQLGDLGFAVEVSANPCIMFAGLS